MKKALMIFLILGSLVIDAFSQKATVNVENVSACMGDTVLVPVTLTNYNNVCAVGIRVAYNPELLKYVKLINVNKEMPGADFANVMNNETKNGIITLGWFSANPKIIANITSGKAFEIMFVYLKSEPAELNLLESGTMASDCNLNAMPLDYKNGKILPKRDCK